MDVKHDLDYMVEFMVKLLKTPSPTGDTIKALNLVEEEFAKYGLKAHKNAKNGFYVSVEGEDDEEQVTLSAHVDTLGCMVKDITGNGRLKLTKLGGYPWNVIEGCECVISTIDDGEYTGTILTNVSSTHVYGAKADETKRDEDSMEIRIDEKVSSRKDVEELGINVGDYVYLYPGTWVTPSGFIKSRHLDDKACVAVLVGLVKYLKENNIKPKHTTNFFISNYEELGHGSTAGLPEKTVEFISVDMAAPGTGQTSSEFKCTVCVKDSSGPYDKMMSEKFIKLARKNDIPYAIDIYPYYGSDASAVLRAGWNVRAALIGPGVDASHSFERTHKEAVDATFKLALAYLLED